MKGLQWWIQPLVRLIAALSLPFAVPAVVTAALWALPGDPAEIICPIETCGEAGQRHLSEHWSIDKGALYFYGTWLSKAVQLDFGNSWRTFTGIPVWDLLVEATPSTAVLVTLAFVPLVLGGFISAVGWLPRWTDRIWQAFGLVPAVILSLMVAAYIQINYVGQGVTEEFLDAARLLTGAVVLALADGALAGAVIGTRTTFEEEVKSRYIQIAILRGETVLQNALPNVLPALVGQFRGRMLHILSGAVIVEVVLGIPGLGDLLWSGTLDQDFAIVLAAAWGYSLLSGAFLFVQAVFEIAVAMHVRRYPHEALALEGAK